MRIDVFGSAPEAHVTMEIGMADIDVALVGMEKEVDVRDRASLVFVLVGMRVHMSAAIPVRVEVHGVGVVGVNAPICMRTVSVILIGPGICVIAMVVVEMIRVGHIPVVVVRWDCVFVVVIAMLHIPVVAMRRVLIRGIQVARACVIEMI